MTNAPNHSMEDLIAIFQRLLPLRSGKWELALRQGDGPALWVNENGSLFVGVQLVIFDSETDSMIMNIKEQDAYLGDYSQHSPARWAAYLEGHLRALPAIGNELGQDIEAVMPFEFFMYPEPLADETLQSADDFARALSNPESLRAWNRAHLIAEWQEMLEPCGLGEHVEAVRALGRPALRMLLDRIEIDEDEPESPEERVIGESRIGGHPDLPPSFVWPEVDGYPLTFAAQINLQEVAKFKNMGDFPKEGLLSFFYAPTPPEEIRDHGARVFHFPMVTELEWRLSPEGAEPISAYSASFAEERVYPCIESHFHYESLLPESTVLPFCEILRDGRAGKEPVPFAPLGNFLSCVNDVYDHERPTHRLLGHPDSIQGDPYLDMEIATREQRWNDWKEGSVEAYRIRKNSLRWRLLLQIDAKEGDELLLNQDGGFFYFFIPADALAKHDWSQVHGVLQCH
jgi:Domain of unknown function (DUF1963)